MHRGGELLAENILQERLLKNEKIEVFWNSILKEVIGKSDQTIPEVAAMNVENLSNGVPIATPVFDGASDVGIQDTLAKSWFVTESGCIQKHGSIDLDLLRDWLSERGYNYEDIYREDIVGLDTEACHRI